MASGYSFVEGHTRYNRLNVYKFPASLLRGPSGSLPVPVPLSAYFQKSLNPDSLLYWKSHRQQTKLAIKMKINTAALALLATTAAAVPMSASEITVTPVTTAVATTATAPSKARAAESPNGPPNEDEYEICVMPTGCRDEAKHDASAGRRPATTSIDYSLLDSLLSEALRTLYPTATSSAKGALSVAPAAEPTSA